MASSDFRSYELNYSFPPKPKNVTRYAIIPQIVPFGNPLPQFIDLRSKWNRMYDQGQIGSCVANAVCGTINFCMNRQQSGPFDPSRLFIYANARGLDNTPVTEDRGCTIRNAFASLERYRVCEESFWPYDQKNALRWPPKEAYHNALQIQNIHKLLLDDGNINQIKQCLFDGFPVVFGAMIFSNFYDANTVGQIPPPPVGGTPIGGHAMAIVGYHNDTKNFIIANSWGETWGEKGFGFLPFDYAANPSLVSDLWTLRYIRELTDITPFQYPWELSAPADENTEGEKVEE